ncbi:MAG: GAK system XXXCH domain-containing protein [Desulfobulbaceae bacterium]|nr:GAK system XXXCH domain-containing protein [Desulfobulbaceae bacterium]
MPKVDQNRSEVVDQKYRPLKKMLKKTVKNITDSVANKQLPPALLMDDFMAQVKVMVSYPSFGDEYYSTFMAACDALYKACRKKDLSLFVECFAVVVSLKKECHHRYR